MRIASGYTQMRVPAEFGRKLKAYLLTQPGVECELIPLGDGRVRLGDACPELAALRERMKP
jgi:hypothetical protein